MIEHVIASGPVDGLGIQQLHTLAMIGVGVWWILAHVREAVMGFINGEDNPDMARDDIPKPHPLIDGRPARMDANGVTRPYTAGGDQNGVMGTTKGDVDRTRHGRHQPPTRDRRPGVADQVNDSATSAPAAHNAARRGVLGFLRGKAK